MKKIISMRIDEDLYKQIKKLADLQNRNFSNFVETVLKEYIDHYSFEDLEK